MRTPTSRGYWVLRAVLTVLGVLVGIVGIALASYGVLSTATWLHVTGHETTVVVDRCQDLGRNGQSCTGHTAGSNARIGGLPYDRSSPGRTLHVWSSGGTAVVGTPWGALWFDAFFLVLLVAGTTRLVRRRSRRPAPR